MPRSRSLAALLMLASLASPIISSSARGDEPRGHAPTVEVLELPDGGIQPQAAADDSGTIHLVDFRGDPAGGDLYYCRTEAPSGPGRTKFARPVRVNSQPGSAIAIGTIRGGQLAIGRGGRVHVAWNGSNSASPKNPAGGVPMLYTRSDPSGTSFEPQRNLMHTTSALDGGGAVAADREGNVYVAWHARTEDAGPGEAHRRMWLARSNDDGATFSAEEPAFDEPTGACGCCGTRALADHNGAVYLLYRAATEGVDRDMYLLRSDDRGRHFRGEALGRWRAQLCPMSSAALADSADGVRAAWETKGQVYFSRLDPQTHRSSPPVSPPTGADARPSAGRKHPAVAANPRGETILVWTEGTGWQKGGSLVWQVFDRDGRSIGPAGRIDNGVPVWGLATVVARPDGGFVIVTSRRESGREK